MGSFFPGPDKPFFLLWTALASLWGADSQHSGWWLHWVRVSPHTTISTFYTISLSLFILIVTPHAAHTDHWKRNLLCLWEHFIPFLISVACFISFPVPLHCSHFRVHASSFSLLCLGQEAQISHVFGKKNIWWWDRISCHWSVVSGILVCKEEKSLRTDRSRYKSWFYRDVLQTVNRPFPSYVIGQCPFVGDISE